MITAGALSARMMLRGLPGRVYFPVLIIWAVMAPPGAHSAAAQDAQVFGTVFALHEMTPLPGVTVTLKPATMLSYPWPLSMAGGNADAAPALECIAGQDGGFLFPAVSPGTYLLQAHGTGIGLSQEHYVETLSGGSPGPFHIHAIPGGAIRGRVYNENSSAGLADISVLADVEGTRERFRTVTNAEGDYAFEHLPPGVCTLSLSCLYRQANQSRQVVIRNNQSIDAFDFALDIPGADAGTIAGQVVDCAGDPIADATVIAQYPVKALEPHRPARNRAKTDETGRFALADLDPDNPFTLAALKTGYTFYHEEVRPRPGELVAVELRREAVIAGIVHDESGQPVENARVNVWRGAHRHAGHTLLCPVENAILACVSRNGVSSGTAKDGAFRIGGLPAGEYRVEVSYEPATSPFSSFMGDFWPKHAVAGASCDLVEGQTLSGLAFSLKTADYLSSISGRVVTADGRPVPGAVVSADNARHTGHATTDLDGAFTIMRLPHGAYPLDANARGYQDYSSHHDDHPFDRGRIKTGVEPVTLVLTESIRVEGRVVNAETGAPIPVYQIGFGRGPETPPDIAPGTLRTRLDPQGRFSLEMNRPATHIVARADGFATTSQALRIGAEARQHEMVLALSPVPDL